jgi:hypothetical protein
MPSALPAPIPTTSPGRHLYAQWDVNRYDGSIVANNGVVGHLNNSFGTINYTCDCFNSSYNSGNVVLRQRASHGLFVQAAYTWGHARDQADWFRLRWLIQEKRAEGGGRNLVKMRPQNTSANSNSTVKAPQAAFALAA